MGDDKKRGAGTLFITTAQMPGPLYLRWFGYYIEQQTAQAFMAVGVPEAYEAFIFARETPSAVIRECLRIRRIPRGCVFRAPRELGTSPFIKEVLAMFVADRALFATVRLF